MATTSLQSLHKLQPFLSHPQPLHNPSSPTKLSFNLSSSSLSLTTTTNTTTAFSLLTPTTTSTASSSSFDALALHLSSSDFRQADEETRRLLIDLAGEGAQKRGYVFFSEVQFIPPEDLQAIDHLWKKHSAGRFGYSVQKRIWEKKAKRDFTSFFIRVGWMKKLDTEVEQWNYRSFPSEFIWELKDDTPEGHLPLTNALRGTQLLLSILTHPAFEDEEEEEEKAEASDGEEKKKERPKLMGGMTSLKPDYSF